MVDAPQGKSSAHRDRYCSIYALLLVCSVALTGCHSADSVERQVDQPQKVIEMIPADLVSVETGQLEKKVQFTGTVRPVKQSHLQAQVSAQALKVKGQVGEFVQKGQLLVVLNNQDQYARLAQAQANLATAKAQAELARSLMQRKKRLFDQGFIAKIEYEQSRVDYQAQLENVKAQQANVSIAQKANHDAEVISPISGHITARYIEPGQIVSPGQTLFEIIDTTQLEIQAAVSATQQQALRVGQDIRYHIQGIEHPLQARIIRIAPTANSANRQIEFFAQPLTPLSSVAIGAYVHGDLIEQQQTGHLIPLNTIQSIEQDPYVWLVRQQRLIKHAIQIVDQDYAGNMALVNGLLPDDQVSRVTFTAQDQNKSVRVAAK